MNIWELTRSLAQEKTDLADQMARMTAHGSRDASYEGNLSDLGGGGHGGLGGLGAHGYGGHGGHGRGHDSHGRATRGKAASRRRSSRGSCSCSWRTA